MLVYQRVITILDAANLTKQPPPWKLRPGICLDIVMKKPQEPWSWKGIWAVATVHLICDVKWPSKSQLFLNHHESPVSCFFHFIKVLYTCGCRCQTGPISLLDSRSDIASGLLTSPDQNGVATNTAGLYLQISAVLDAPFHLRWPRSRNTGFWSSVGRISLRAYCLVLKHELLESPPPPT